MDTRADITEFIKSNFIKGKNPPNLEDASFLEEGIIDSVGVMELVAFLEDRFKFRVEDDEIIPENLDSINKLCSYVEKKLKSIA